MRAVAGACRCLAIATGATTSSALDVTVLPKPGFPLPAGDVDSSSPRLELVLSKYRSPVDVWFERRPALPAWAPQRVHGEPRQQAIYQRGAIWRSPALVGNAGTFVDGGYIVSSYGFTAEPDFLYLLDRRTGKVLDSLSVPSAPEIIKLRGKRLHVRTYDHQVVARILR
jgi:hypothetical protein